MRHKAILLILALFAICTTALNPGTASPSQGQQALRIGLLLDFSGDLAEWGPPLQNAANLAAKNINDAGGVLGQPIQIVVGDSASSPQVGVQEALRLIDQEGVSVIVGDLASGVTLAVAQNATVPNGILQISPASTSPNLTTLPDNDLLFRTALSDVAQGKVLASLARELGYHTASTLYVNNSYGQGLSDIFASNFTELGGQVLATVPLETGQPTYLPQLQQATAGDPDVLAAITYPQEAITYLNEAIGNGLADKFLFVDGTKSQQIIDAVGAQPLNGMYGVAPAEVQSAAGDAFDAAYQAEYGEPPLIYAREAYDAVMVAALAAQAAHSTDSTQIRNALRRVANPPGQPIGLGAAGGIATALSLVRSGQDVDYQGASGMVDFDANGDVASGAVEVWRIDNGQIVTVRTDAVQLGSITNVRVDPLSKTVPLVGGNFTLDVKVENVTNLGAFQFDVVFDPTLMQFQSFTEGPFLASSGRTTSCSPSEIAPGTERYNCSSGGAQAGPDGSGVVATVTFSPVAADTSAVSLTNGSLSDATAGADPIDTMWQNGSVTVGCAYDVDGDAGIDIRDVQLVFAHWPAPPLTYNATYDVDKNGNINIRDVQLVFAHWPSPPRSYCQ